MPFLGTTGGGSVKQYGGQANLGYFIKNSLRTRSSASGYFNKTLTTPTNNLKWTWSAWIKRGTLSASNVIFGAGDGSSNNFGSMQFTSGDTIQFAQINAGAYNVQMITSAVFRDPAAWYHIVLVYDSANATSTDRVQIYVNSVRQSVTYSTGPFAQNTASKINSAIAHYISKLDYTTVYFDGYQAEVNFIDGQALTPSSFGKTDAATNQWIPKKFAGTYGTNGFYLKFADTSAATAAAIGKDSSGNGNNWTPNNISVTAGVTYDAMIDSPTLSAAASNYCVFNPLDTGSSNMVASNGNLTFTKSSSGFAPIRGTVAVTTGKYYFEMLVNNSNITQIGVSNSYNIKQNGGDNSLASSGANGAAWDSRGFLYHPSGGGAYAYTFTTNNTVMVAFDASSGKIWFGKNGTWNTGDPATETSPAYTASGYDFLTPFGNGEGGGSGSTNFGQQPFAYTPPTGFKSLNTFNLP